MELRVANANGSCENGACDCKGTWVGAALLTLLPPSLSTSRHLLGPQARGGGSQRQILTRFPNCPEDPVWRRCRLPSDCRGDAETD